MKAWTQLLEPGPAIATFCIALLLATQCHAAPTLADHGAEQSTEIEYYPVADATGCYYNFQHYDEGDRIITNEPCLNCTCHNRMLMCYLRVCPFTKAIGANCKVEKRPDQCCPVITCPEVPVQLVTSTAPSTALGHINEYGCSIDNLFYSDGARVPSNPENPCELCYCIRNKTACVIQQCTLEVEDCRPVFQEGVCCPVRYNCDHPEYLEGPTTPQITTTTTTTTTEAPITTLQPFECVFNGQKYNDGELVQKDIPCVKCYCIRGDIVCAVQECGPTPLDKVNCTALPITEGQCCPDTYDCAGVIEEELTTLSSASYETEPTTTSVAFGGTEQPLTTTYIPQDEQELQPGHKKDETYEAPEVVTKALPRPVTPEFIEEAEETTEKAEEEATRPEDIEVSSAEPEQVTIVGVDTTEKEAVTIVTAITPEGPLSEASTEKPPEQEENVFIPTEGPIEAITAHVTEVIESLTSRVTEAVEAFTTSIIGSSTEQATSTSPAEEVEKEAAPTQGPEHDKTGVTSAPSDKEQEPESSSEPADKPTEEIEKKLELTTDTSVHDEKEEPEAATVSEEEQSKIVSESQPTEPSELLPEQPILPEKCTTSECGKIPTKGLPPTEPTLQEAATPLPERVPELVPGLPSQELPEQATTTESEEVIIVTEIPTRKTELPESMDHVSETAYSIEGPKGALKPEPEATTHSEAPTGITHPSEARPELQTETPQAPAEGTQKPIRTDEDTKATEESTPSLDQEQKTPITELPREQDNEIEHDEVGTVTKTEEHVTEGKVPEQPTTLIPTQPEEAETQGISKEQPTTVPTKQEAAPEESSTARLPEEITEKVIVPEVCTSEGECAPVVIPEVLEQITEFPTKPEEGTEEAQVPPEITTENNEISEQPTEETNEIPESGTEVLPKITETEESSGDEATEGSPTKEGEEGSGEAPEEGSGATQPIAEATTAPGISSQVTTTKAELPGTELPEQPTTSQPEQPTTSQPEQPTTSQPEATEHPVQTEVPEREIPGEGSCLVDGQTYKNNSSVPAINHCQTSCRCISSILRCESIECSPPALGLQNCLPIFTSPDSCCPTYSCTGSETTSTIESDSHTAQTTPSLAEETSTDTSELTEGPSETTSVPSGTQVQPELTTAKVAEEEATEPIPIDAKATEIPESATAAEETTEAVHKATEPGQPTQTGAAEQVTFSPQDEETDKSTEEQHIEEISNPASTEELSSEVPELPATIQPVEETKKDVIPSEAGAVTESATEAAEIEATTSQPAVKETVKIVTTEKSEPVTEEQNVEITTTAEEGKEIELVTSGAPVPTVVEDNLLGVSAEVTATPEVASTTDIAEKPELPIITKLPQEPIIQPEPSTEAAQLEVTDLDKHEEPELTTIAAQGELTETPEKAGTSPNATEQPEGEEVVATVQTVSEVPIATQAPEQISGETTIPTIATEEENKEGKPHVSGAETPGDKEAEEPEAPELETLTTIEQTDSEAHVEHVTMPGNVYPSKPIESDSHVTSPPTSEAPAEDKTNGTDVTQAAGPAEPAQTEAAPSVTSREPEVGDEEKAEPVTEALPTVDEGVAATKPPKEILEEAKTPEAPESPTTVKTVEAANQPEIPALGPSTPVAVSEQQTIRPEEGQTGLATEGTTTVPIDLGPEMTPIRETELAPGEEATQLPEKKITVSGEKVEVATVEPEKLSEEVTVKETETPSEKPSEVEEEATSLPAVPEVLETERPIVSEEDKENEILPESSYPTEEEKQTSKPAVETPEEEEKIAGVGTEQPNVPEEEVKAGLKPSSETEEPAVSEEDKTFRPEQPSTVTETTNEELPKGTISTKIEPTELPGAATEIPKEGVVPTEPEQVGEATTTLSTEEVASSGTEEAGAAVTEDGVVLTEPEKAEEEATAPPTEGVVLGQAEEAGPAATETPQEGILPTETEKAGDETTELPKEGAGPGKAEEGGTTATEVPKGLVPTEPEKVGEAPTKAFDEGATPSETGEAGPATTEIPKEGLMPTEPELAGEAPTEVSKQEVAPGETGEGAPAATESPKELGSTEPVQAGEAPTELPKEGDAPGETLKAMEAGPAATEIPKDGLVPTEPEQAGEAPTELPKEGAAPSGTQKVEAAPIELPKEGAAAGETEEGGPAATEIPKGLVPTEPEQAGEGPTDLPKEGAAPSETLEAGPAATEIPKELSPTEPEEAGEASTEFPKEGGAPGEVEASGPTPTETPKEGIVPTKPEQAGEATTDLPKGGVIPGETENVGTSVTEIPKEGLALNGTVLGETEEDGSAATEIPKGLVPTEPEQVVPTEPEEIVPPELPKEEAAPGEVEEAGPAATEIPKEGAPTELEETGEESTELPKKGIAPTESGKAGETPTEFPKEETAPGGTEEAGAAATEIPIEGVVPTEAQGPGEEPTELLKEGEASSTTENHKEEHAPTESAPIESPTEGAVPSETETTEPVLEGELIPSATEKGEPVATVLPKEEPVSSATEKIAPATDEEITTSKPEPTELPQAVPSGTEEAGPEVTEIPKAEVVPTEPEKSEEAPTEVSEEGVVPIESDPGQAAAARPDEKIIPTEPATAGLPEAATSGEAGQGPKEPSETEQAVTESPEEGVEKVETELPEETATSATGKPQQVPPKVLPEEASETEKSTIGDEVQTTVTEAPYFAETQKPVADSVGPIVYPEERPLEGAITTPSPEEVANISLPVRGGELFTSGPQAEGTTKKHVPGELSTSVPISEPTTILPVTTSTEPPPASIPGEEVPDQNEYEQGEDYDDGSNAFGPGTCRYGGKVYVSAQQIPRDDPCDFCFCFRSDIICLQQSCPPPIPRCHEEPIRGFCCPRYECPVSMATAVNITTSTTTTTTTIPPHFLSHAYKGRASKTGCQISGKAYKVGDVIRSTSGPCLHCTCGGDGQMKCDPKPCSPEPMLRQMIAAAALRRRR